MSVLHILDIGNTHVLYLYVRGTYRPQRTNETAHGGDAPGPPVSCYREVATKTCTL